MYQHGSPRALPNAQTTTKKLSPDSKQAKPLLSAMKKNNNRRYNKKVHWHPGVVENEYKHKRALKRTTSAATLMFKLPEASTSTSVTPKAGCPDSFENYLASIGQISAQREHRLQVAPSRPPEMPKPSTQSTVLKSASSPPSTNKTHHHVGPPRPCLDIPSWILGTQPFFVANSLTQRSNRSTTGIPEANSERKRDSVNKLRSSSTTESTKQLENRANKVPPAVPDAPAPRREGPPPTPRISRLPTPDLSDMSDGNFCTCPSERHGKHYLSKMTEQLNAAKAHIKEQTKGKPPRM